MERVCETSSSSKIACVTTNMERKTGRLKIANIRPPATKCLRFMLPAIFLLTQAPGSAIRSRSRPAQQTEILTVLTQPYDLGEDGMNLSTEQDNRYCLGYTTSLTFNPASNRSIAISV